MKCEKDFDVPRSGFEANSTLANELANELHLNDEEKSIKCAIQGLIKQLEQLQGSINLKRDEMELANCNHFIQSKYGTLTYACLETITVHQNGVNCIRRLTSNLIASGDSDRKIKIWNLECGECLQAFNSHTDWITGLVYFPNADLVSCSGDKTIKESERSMRCEHTTGTDTLNKARMGSLGYTRYLLLRHMCAK